MDPWLALLYGGAKGGGKDFFFCQWVKTWSEWLIRFWDLQPSPNPVPIGFIGRKRGVDMKATTLEEWKKVIPADHYRFHDDHREIILHETIKIHVGGLDDPKRVQKFNSANYAFFALNQVEEVEREEVSVLRGALRLVVNGKTPPYRELYTANPADCWLKTEFVDEDTRLPGHIFVPALYTDNEHLPANYRQTLETAFRHNQPLLRAYRDGDWRSLSASNVLITGAALDGLKGVIRHLAVIRRIIACDPSLGGDECTIKCIENGKVIDAETLVGERDPEKIAARNVEMAQKWSTPFYAIDYSGGLGEGIAAIIRKLHKGANVTSLNSSEQSSNPERWYNLRAEMWWSLMEKIANKEIPWPENEELRRQLVAVRFKVVGSNGCIQLELKEKTKDRLGRSPDDADCFVYGNFVLPRTTPLQIKQADGWRDLDHHNSEVSSGVGSAMTA